MYHARKSRFLIILAALSAITMPAFYQVATAAGANLVFAYPTGFASMGSAINIAGQGALSGTTIQLTTAAGGHEAGAAWYRIPQNIQSFTTDFTFQLDPSDYGLWFVVQNSNATTNPPGCCGSYYGVTAVADANGEGYGDYYGQQSAIANSVGLKFDLTNFNNNAHGLPANISTTGVYVDGGPVNANFAPANDLAPFGINLHSNHVMSAHVVYDGALLTMVLTDTATLAQARLSWPINIPAIVGANTAYVGFTAGRIAAVTSSLLSWTYYTGFNTVLPAPTFSVPTGSYNTPQSVTLSASPGAAIWYTTNGKPPTTASTLYTGPITVSSNQIIQAIAVESGYTDSPIAVGNYQVAASGSPMINLPNGFSGASNLIALTGNATFNGSSLSLTDTANYNETAAAWYEAPVNIQSFTSNFTLQFTNVLTNSATGMTFTIQNRTAATSRGANSGGPYALSNPGGEFGYGGTDAGGGIMQSIAIAFDLASVQNSVGLYTNGARPAGSQLSTGLNFLSGDPFTVAFAYNGTNLTMSMTDTVTHANFSHSWAINIPLTVGGNNAYVGFTAATGPGGNQIVNGWTYSPSGAVQSAAVPAAPTNIRIQ